MPHLLSPVKTPPITKMKIIMDITVTASAPITTAELYSLAGVRAAAVVCDGNESVILNTVSVPSGIYVLRATTATGSESTFKLIKK